MLVDLRGELDVVEMVQPTKGRWVWLGDPGGLYTICSAYKALQHSLSGQVDSFYNFLWARQVPSKVQAFAWRLSRSQLPTKANVLKRGVIQHAQTTCVFYNREQEMEEHLFLICLQGH